ncbi:MAG: radical SAM protein [bacterium]|nr:radical SAM protein [bacterium]
MGSGNLSRSLTQLEIDLKIARIDAVLPHLYRRSNPCFLCPRRCGVLRLYGELGECRLPAELRVASVALHQGEEPPISGENGAVNIFFSGCNLHCIHCQNWPVSQYQYGSFHTPRQLAEKILKKKQRGAQTLGWVTPTTQIVHALEAYRLCLLEGFDLPLVHNDGGYEDVEIIELLAGIVDIWLPDAKTRESQVAREIQKASDYPDINRLALAAMVKQADRGETRAVIVRHLVLPDNTADSKNVLSDLYLQFGNRIHLSLMMQYFPFHKTINHSLLGRRITEAEYEEVIDFAVSTGFEKGWVQEYDTETGIPFHCLP